MEDQELEINEKEYCKGFNDGLYILKYEPDLAKELLFEQIDIRNDYHSGFNQGLQAEKELDIIQEFDQLRNQDNEQEIERDR